MSFLGQSQSWYSWYAILMFTKNNETSVKRFHYFPHSNLSAEITLWVISRKRLNSYYWQIPCQLFSVLDAMGSENRMVFLLVLWALHRKFSCGWIWSWHCFQKVIFLCLVAALLQMDVCAYFLTWLYWCFTHCLNLPPMLTVQRTRIDPIFPWNAQGNRLLTILNVWFTVLLLKST